MTCSLEIILTTNKAKFFFFHFTVHFCKFVLNFTKSACFPCPLLFQLFNSFVPAVNCFQPPPVIQCCSLESRELSVPISPFIMMLPDYIDYLLNMVAGRCEALRVQSLIINLIILSQKFKFCHINLTITGSMHIAYFLFPFITKRKQIQTADPHKSTIIQFIKSHNWGSLKAKIQSIMKAQTAFKFWIIKDHCQRHIVPWWRTHFYTGEHLTECKLLTLLLQHHNSIFPADLHAHCLNREQGSGAAVAWEVKQPIRYLVASLGKTLNPMLATDALSGVWV